MKSDKYNWQPEIWDSIGLIFLIQRRLTFIFDKMLAPSDLTTKQWLVLAAVNDLDRERPAIQEIARQLSTSHQNIKAIGLQLEKKGYIRLVRDPVDRRVTRLVVTPKSKQFWRVREAEHKILLMELFKTMTEKEKLVLRKKLNKLLKGIDEISKKLVL